MQESADGQLVAVLVSALEVLDKIVAEMEVVEQWMRANLAEDEIVRLLESIPGVGLILAHVIRAEIGELAELVFIIWKKRTPYEETPPARPGRSSCEPARAPRGTKNAVSANMRPDQSQHPIARRGTAGAGQAHL